MNTTGKAIGIVIIGRNEGERLKNCVRSLANDSSRKIVYVDSASSDDSVSFVKNEGFDVVELDMSLPFSAARARNEGYRFLLERYHDIEFIQFVDGDCEVDAHWLNTAKQHLEANTKLAAVCGRRKERYPEKTIYNKLCDIEWNTPIGKAKATGGDFLCRASALVEVNGFNPQVIAGEEPELCFRLRSKGWELERIDALMTLHDANMTSIKQWFKRNERSGHAYAQGFDMHGSSEEKFKRSDVMRITLWGLAIPVAIILAALIFGSFALFAFLIYPIKIAQIARKEIPKHGVVAGLAYSTSLMMGKFAELKGIANYLIKRLSGQKFEIIEYKGSND